MATTAQVRSTNSIMDRVLSYESIDGKYATEVVWENRTMTLWLSAVYVAMVFIGPRIMKSRPAVDLRRTLGVWSSILAVFSIYGAIRTVPELLATATRSFEDSVCDTSFVVTPPTALWALLFTLSKPFELMDTVFLVLKKRPVIFLHWFHHFTVMVYCFYAYGYPVASGRYFLTLNYCVHAVMYSYYALKSFRFQIPKSVSVLITFMQLTQMLIGVFITYMSHYYLNLGHPCSTNNTLIYWTFVMYSTYFILFANFFYQSYLKPKPKRT